MNVRQATELKNEENGELIERATRNRQETYKEVRRVTDKMLRINVRHATELKNEENEELIERATRNRQETHKEVRRVTDKI
jgi:phage shock protein A